MRTQYSSNDVAPACLSADFVLVLICPCSAADTTSRGIVNFGQTLVWYAGHLLSTRKQRQASSRQLLEQLEEQQWQ